jgi:hypothetical protein
MSEVLCKHVCILQKYEFNYTTLLHVATSFLTYAYYEKICTACCVLASDREFTSVCYAENSQPVRGPLFTDHLCKGSPHHYILQEVA